MMPLDRYAGEKLDAIIEEPPSPFRLVRPDAGWINPFILTVPHSGRYYPSEFMKMVALDIDELRRSEDAYIDLMIGGSSGFHRLIGEVARLCIDLNREETELDPELFPESLAKGSALLNCRVRAGLGILPRLAGGQLQLYRDRPTLQEAQRRIDRYHRPYHETLRSLIAEAKAAFGSTIILDCHSMPSASQASPDTDIVLGNCYGASCAPGLVERIENFFSKYDLSVRRNMPYAGGYVTQHYGRPDLGQHVLQIEINRRLYLDEDRLALHSGFTKMKKLMEELWVECAHDWCSAVS